MEQRACECQSLEIAERQRPGAAVRVGLERESLDRPPNDRALADAGQATRDVEVLANRQLGVRGRALDEMTDTPPQVGGTRMDSLAEQVGMAGRRADHPEQHPDRRRLAGAVKAEEGVDLASGDPEVDPVDRQHVAAVPLRQAARGDRQLGHAGISPSEAQAAKDEAVELGDRTGDVIWDRQPPRGVIRSKP